MEKKTFVFDIKRVSRRTWESFSQYHYLSKKLPGGHNEFFGLFYEGKQIGFQAFSNYVPDRKGTKRIMHFNRTVIHPDYVGLGLGVRFINATSKIMHDGGFRIMAKFSSVPVYKALSKNERWRLKNVSVPVRARAGKTLDRKLRGMRAKVKIYSFEYVPEIE